MPGEVKHHGDGDEKWEAQLRKGCLEMAVLAALAPARSYGLEIIRTLEKHSDLKNHVLVAWRILKMREDRGARPAFEDVARVMFALRARLSRRDVRKVAALVESTDPGAASWFAQPPKRPKTGFRPFRSRARRP